jgi:hypothetical protein
MAAETVGSRAQLSLSEAECVPERNRARTDPCVVAGPEPDEQEGLVIERCGVAPQCIGACSQVLGNVWHGFHVCGAATPAATSFRDAG